MVTPEDELNEIIEEREPWLRLGEPALGDITSGQESAIRGYALGEGFEDLRGFHMWLRSRGWDYYDILRIVSPYV